MNRHRPALPLVFASLLAAAAAQSPQCWLDGPMDVNQLFAGVKLGGPAGGGLLYLSTGILNPPIPTPFGDVRINPLTLFPVAVGPMTPAAPLAAYFSIPNDPSLQDILVAFQGAAFPSAAPGTASLSSAVFTRLGPLPGVWPPLALSNQLFGRSLALGDRDLDGNAELLVGAPTAWNANATAQVGAVTVWSGPAQALWQTVLGTQGGASFGHEVAMAQVDGVLGADLIVSEPAWDVSPIEVEIGRVHVYYAPSYTTGTVLTVTPPAGAPMQYFGFGLLAADLGGDGKANVVVGAPLVGPGVCKVYVYGDHTGTTIPLAAVISSPTGPGEFGRELAAGNLATGTAALELAVADRAYAPAGGSNRGRVYVYAGTTLTTTLQSPSPVDNGFFGHALATGDLTGDGVADLAVGAPGEGKVHVYAGSASGVPTAPTLTLTTPGTFGASGYGQDLLIADFDADGANDLVVGQLPAAGVGHAFVYLGTPGQANSFALVALIGDRDTAINLFGTAFAAGDTDGNGQQELWCGAPLKGNGVVTTGKVFRARVP